MGGTHSETASPALSSPGQNTGCINFKWDDAAGKSKYKAGGYTSATGRIAPEKPTPGKTKIMHKEKSRCGPESERGGEAGRKPQQTGHGPDVYADREA
jgi:hypothetical protein